MSNSEPTERNRALVERDKAVNYYEDTGLRGSIQDLLNITYFEVGVDIVT